jgi:hypothetical protein
VAAEYFAVHYVWILGTCYQICLLNLKHVTLTPSTNEPPIFLPEFCSRFLRDLL